jgi:hypothetical protein
MRYFLCRDEYELSLKLDLSGTLIEFSNLHADGMSKCRQRSSAIPEKNIFYLLRLLGSAFRLTPRTDNIDYFIIKIIGYKCIKAGERAKQYIPLYMTESDCKNHFRNNW